MRAEKRAIQAAQVNVARATNVVAVAESGLTEITTLLNDLEDLVDRSANESGISDDEAAANQQEIDAILGSINRIANSTELQGRKLLQGDLAYTTSGVSTGDISHLRLNSARVPDGGFRGVAVDVTAAASLATVSYTGGAIGATPVTIEVAGNLGTERITLASASVANVASAINQSTGVTGVSAVVSGTNVVMTSTDYGSTEFVKVRALSGTFTMDTTAGTDYGADVQANINGQTVTGRGLTVGVRTGTLDADIKLSAAFGSDAAGGTSTFSITGGGAHFMIAPKLDLNGLASLGIASVSTSSLGDSDEGFLYSLGSGEANAISQKTYSQSQRVIRNSLSQVASLRARLGSFEKNTLDTNKNSLAIQYENLSAAESIIRDTDFAQETSNLTRQQILVQSASNVLRLANAQPQQVLSLLG